MHDHLCLSFLPPQMLFPKRLIRICYAVLHLHIISFSVPIFFFYHLFIHFQISLWLWFTSRAHTIHPYVYECYVRIRMCMYIVHTMHTYIFNRNTGSLWIVIVLRGPIWRCLFLLHLPSITHVWNQNAAIPARLVNSRSHPLWLLLPSVCLKNVRIPRHCFFLLLFCVSLSLSVAKMPTSECVC